MTDESGMKLGIPKELKMLDVAPPFAKPGWF
jgi:hypothetical protein